MISRPGNSQSPSPLLGDEEILAVRQLVAGPQLPQLATAISESNATPPANFGVAGPEDFILPGDLCQWSPSWPLVVHTPRPTAFTPTWLEWPLGFSTDLTQVMHPIFQ